MNKFLKILLLLALAVSITACSDEKSASSDGGEKVIQFMTYNPYGEEEFRSLVADYEAANPGVKLEITISPNEYNTNLSSKLNAGQLPDIFLINVGSNYEQYSEYLYDFTNDSVVDLFAENALKTAYLGDKVMGLPLSFENMGWIYNKDVFAQAGITELPRTISELEDACKKMDSIGIPAFSIAGKETWVLHQMASLFLAEKDTERDELIAAYNSGEKEFKNSPNLANLFKVLDLINMYGTDKQLENDWESSESDLAAGEAGIIQMGDWCWNILKEFNPDVNVGIMPVPVSENPDDAVFLSNISWMVVVNEDSKNLEEAKAFAKHFVTGEAGVNWTTSAVGLVPSITGEFEISNPIANDALLQMESSMLWNHDYWPPAVGNDFGAIMQSYILDQTRPDEAIDELQSLWDNAL